MANHYATQILDALKTKLSVPPLASVVAANVFAEDVYPNEAANIPGINLTIGDSVRERKGTVNTGATGPLIEVENAVNVEIEILVAQASGTAALIRQIAKEIEARWLATPLDRNLGVPGLRDSQLVADNKISFEIDNDLYVGTKILQFECRVRSYEGRPDQT